MQAETRKNAYKECCKARKERRSQMRLSHFSLVITIASLLLAQTCGCFALVNPILSAKQCDEANLLSQRCIEYIYSMSTCTRLRVILDDEMMDTDNAVSDRNSKRVTVETPVTTANNNAGVMKINGSHGRIESNDSNGTSEVRRQSIDRFTVNGDVVHTNGDADSILVVPDKAVNVHTQNEKIESKVTSTSVISSKADDRTAKAKSRSKTKEKGEKDPKSTTVRSIWRRRNARSAEEGIRRERSTTRTQLVNILAKADSIDSSQSSSSGDDEDEDSGKHYAARTISGLIHALADEAQDLEVAVHARRDTPLWDKHVDSVKISFSRLGFKPLRMGGLENPEIERDINANSQPVPASADEAFKTIDVDQSGALDSDEIAQALNYAAQSPEKSQDSKTVQMLKGLAAELVKLYDSNGDGVVDRKEYQTMVDDMAAVREAQRNEGSKDGEESDGWLNNIKSGIRGIFFRDNVASNSTKTDKNTTSTVSMSLNGRDNETGEPIYTADGISLTDTSDIMAESVATHSLGSITLSDLKLDLRRLFFGAVPLIKHITPGGPLILEPFTATITASFSREDMKNSVLLDAGLRRLVAMVLRRRVRYFRDFIDGAVFYGRTWKDTSATAPVVEVPDLSDIEFDKQNRIIITGRAKIRTRRDAPKFDQAFKVRAKIGSRMNGQFIRLVEPELAFVLECPKKVEEGVRSIYKRLNMPEPEKPKPLYSFFPIYSPFKVDDNDGFNLGEDNRIEQLFIKDGALFFKMSAVLRPGRFLGSHYLAFTIPNRTFIITLERVREGMRSARKMKKAAKKSEKLASKSQRRFLFIRKNVPHIDRKLLPHLPRGGGNVMRKQPKSFFSRFVDGYLQAESVKDEEELKSDKNNIMTAISDFFGRQGTNETITTK